MAWSHQRRAWRVPRIDELGGDDGALGSNGVRSEDDEVLTTTGTDAPRCRMILGGMNRRAANGLVRTDLLLTN